MMTIKETLIASVVVIMGSSAASAIVTDGMLTFHGDEEIKKRSSLTIESPVAIEPTLLPQVVLPDHWKFRLQAEDHKAFLGNWIKSSTYVNTMIVMPLMSLPLMGFHRGMTVSSYFQAQSPLKFTMRCGLVSALVLNAYFHHIALTNYSLYENLHRTDREFKLIKIMTKGIVNEVRISTREIINEDRLSKREIISNLEMSKKNNSNKD